MRSSPFRNRRAANAIEFALTFPVVLLMMGAVMDWGWYFSQQMQLNAAVRDAARIGAMTSREDHPADVAEEVLMAQIAADGHQGTVRLDVRVEGEEKDESLHIGVAIPYQGPVGIVPVPAEIRASQSLRLEDQAS